MLLVAVKCYSSSRENVCKQTEVHFDPILLSKFSASSYANQICDVWSKMGQKVTKWLNFLSLAAILRGQVCNKQSHQTIPLIPGLKALLIKLLTSCAI